MTPTNITQALLRLGKVHNLRHHLKTQDLCNGINRIQWEGKWLNPGVPARVAYFHTHWVAHFNGWVLCTACLPDEWPPRGNVACLRGSGEQTISHHSSLSNLMEPELKPCAHCGHEAHFGEVHEEGSENDGGEFIECTNPQCGMSTLLMFPTMDEVKSLLAERWNARAGNAEVSDR